MPLSSHNKSLIYVSIAVLSWATVATAFKIALRQLSYFELLLIASVTACLFFLVVLLFTGKVRLLKRLKKKEWMQFACLALLNPVAYYLVLFKAYSLLPAQIAQPINYAWPVVLTVLSAIFLRKPIPALKYVGLLISLAGVVLISLGGKSSDAIALSYFGLFLAAFSAILWASYWIASERNAVNKTVSLFLTFFFGSVYLVCLVPVMGFHFPEKSALFAGMYVGAFEMGIPFLFFSLAMRYTHNPALTNQLCYLSPFFSLILISMILKENVLVTTYLGLALIVGGILFNRYGIKGKKE